MDITEHEENTTISFIFCGKMRIICREERFIVAIYCTPTLFHLGPQKKESQLTMWAKKESKGGTAPQAIWQSHLLNFVHMEFTATPFPTIQQKHYISHEHTQSYTHFSSLYSEAVKVHLSLWSMWNLNGQAHLLQEIGPL